MTPFSYLASISKKKKKAISHCTKTFALCCSVTSTCTPYLASHHFSHLLSSISSQPPNCSHSMWMIAFALFVMPHFIPFVCFNSIPGFDLTPSGSSCSNRAFGFLHCLCPFTQSLSAGVALLTSSLCLASALSNKLGFWTSGCFWWIVVVFFHV